MRPCVVARNNRNVLARRKPVGLELSIVALLSVEHGYFTATTEIRVLCVGAANLDDRAIRFEPGEVHDLPFHSLSLRAFESDRLTLATSE